VPATNTPERAVLFGRERETELLKAMLSRGRERGDARVIRGDPGVGKSALLGYAGAVALATGFRVLTATGVQSEAELPFAGLDQVLRALPWTAEALPVPQKEAVLAAFGRSTSSVPDPFLSHRTVGSHLYRLFPKLGITSRAQLGAALART
jgi:hypothetical protein